MRHTVIIADTEAEIDAAPAGDIERASLVLLRDALGATVRVFKARHSPNRGHQYGSIEAAFEVEGSYLP